jgi:hypothetical protein
VAVLSLPACESRSTRSEAIIKMGGALSIQCCVERATTDEQEDPERPTDPAKASVVTTATPWHKGAPMAPRILPNLPRTISNATTLPN